MKLMGLFTHVVPNLHDFFNFLLTQMEKYWSLIVFAMKLELSSFKKDANTKKVVYITFVQYL